ncbi:hypothetical protein HDV05_001379, partial [Chytridiales sp. JEL 0842]
MAPVGDGDDGGQASLELKPGDAAAATTATTAATTSQMVINELKLLSEPPSPQNASRPSYAPWSDLNSIVDSLDVLCPLIPILDNAPTSLFLAASTIVTVSFSYTLILNPNSTYFLITALVPLYTGILLTGHFTTSFVTEEKTKKPSRKSAESVRVYVSIWWLSLLVVTCIASRCFQPAMVYIFEKTTQPNVMRFHPSVPSNCHQPQVHIVPWKSNGKERLVSAFRREEEELLFYQLDSNSLKDMDMFQFVVRCRRVASHLQSPWYFYDEASQ